MTWLYTPYTYAPVTEDSSLPCENGEYEPYVTLSGTPTRRPLSWHGWKRRTWIQRLYGTISQPSTADRGVAAWISSLEGSHAPTSRTPANEPAPPDNIGYGRTSPESSVKHHHEWCSSKTCLASSQGWASEAVAYVAGLVDGEGSVTIQRNEHRGTPQYALCLAIEMDLAKSAVSLNVCRQVFGGNITANRQGRNEGAHSATAAWRVHGAQAACALDVMLPVLRSKREQAEAAVGLFRREAERPTMKNGKRGWTAERLDDWRSLYERMRQLNRRGDQPMPDGAIAVLVGDRWMERVEANLFESAHWETFSGPLPRSGSMRNGVVYQRQPLAPRTSVSVSGSWPTACARDAKGKPGVNGDFQSLPKAVEAWGTPVARDDQKSPEAHLAMKERRGQVAPTSLTVQAKIWRGDIVAPPTHGHQGEATISDGASGSQRVTLNPSFLEALMGLPAGWSEA